MGLAEGARHDDRELRDAVAPADPAEDLEPVHLRHHHVENHGVEAPFRERLERLGPRRCGRDGVARGDEPAGEEVAVRLVVVDDEDRGAAAFRARARIALRSEHHRTRSLRPGAAR